MMCPFQDHKELLWQHKNYPSRLESWINLESAKLKKHAELGDKNLGVFGKTTLPEALLIAQEKFGHLTTAELNQHKMSHGHCITSAY